MPGLRRRKTKLQKAAYLQDLWNKTYITDIKDRYTIENEPALASYCDTIDYASHPQALKQCVNYLKTHFPTAKQVEIEDTAIICPLAAGLDRGLFLVQNNIADNKNNRTEFRMFKKPSKRFIHKQKLSTPMISSEIVCEKSIQVFLVALSSGTPPQVVMKWTGSDAMNTFANSL